MDLGDNLLHARAVSNLASILKEQGDIVAALARYDEALGIFRQLGDDQGVAWTLRHQGDIARDQQDFELAESLTCSRWPCSAIWRMRGAPAACSPISEACR
jgi:tetratricopeptide (TPR) repeat protein